MLMYSRNLSVCLEVDHNQSRSEMGCGSQMEANIASGLSVFVITINVSHVVVLSQIQSQRNSPFFTILWLSAVLDITLPLFECLNQICIVRKFVFSYPILVVIATTIEGSLLMVRGSIVTFAICERWLMLAKPFEYSEWVFIKMFNGWICMSAIFFTLLNILTYLIMYFVDSLICYDSGIGMLYSDSPEMSCVISTPYLLLFICIILAAALFYGEFNKMKTPRISTVLWLWLTHKLFWHVIMSLHLRSSTFWLPRLLSWWNFSYWCKDQKL